MKKMGVKTEPISDFIFEKCA